MFKRKTHRMIYAALVMVFALTSSNCEQERREIEANKRREEILGKNAPTPQPTKSAEPKSLVGTWNGKFKLTQWTMHLSDEQGAEMIEKGIAKSMNKDHPVTLEITDNGGVLSATMTLNGTTILKGMGQGNPDDFTLNFRHEGDKEIKMSGVGTYGFLFRGFVDQPNTIRGRVAYTAYQKAGPPAWDETGNFEAVRR